MRQSGVSEYGLRSSRMKVRFILPVSIRKRFSLLQTIEDIHFGLVRMYVTPYRISWIIFTSDFGNKLYRQIVGIPMDTNCAPLVCSYYFSSVSVAEWPPFGK